MKTIRILACVLMLVGSAHSLAQEQVPQQLVLFVGDTRVLEVDSIRIAIGNGQIVSVSAPSEGQLLFLGATPGTTTVNVWERSGLQHRIAVTVTESDVNAALETVQQLLRGTRNIGARLAGNKIVLEGDGVSEADQQRAASIVQAFGGLVMNFIGKIVWEQMIHFNVKIVEVRRNAVRQLGIRWDTTAAGPSLRIGGGIDAAFTSIINSQLEALEQKGDAYVIAQPTLSCRSGGSARFVSGGELPIPITDALGTTNVEFKEFGVILDVKPVADRAGSIFAQIETEVSQVDQSVSVLGVPGFIKRKSITEVNMREGETIAIAGLVDRSRSKDRQQVPGLGSVPLLGAAFRTDQKRFVETELLVLLSPRFVSAQARPGMVAADPNGDALRRAEQIIRTEAAETPPPQAPVIAPVASGRTVSVPQIATTAATPASKPREMRRTASRRPCVTSVTTCARPTRAEK
jgi:pilus assembly protein CpaC